MKLTLIALAVPAILMANAAFAAEGEHSTVNFTGNIVEATCALAADSKDQTVDLGDVTANILRNAYDTAAERDFSINLEGCDTSVAESASVTFSGDVTTDNSARRTLLKTDGMGTTYTGIQILQDGEPLVLDGSMASRPLTLTDVDNNSMALTARYYHYADNPAKPGPANATVNFTVRYE